MKNRLLRVALLLTSASTLLLGAVVCFAFLFVGIGNDTPVDGNPAHHVSPHHVALGYIVAIFVRIGVAFSIWAQIRFDKIGGLLLGTSVPVGIGIFLATRVSIAVYVLS